MFFKYITEIESAIPTSKWDNEDKLIGLLEEEEDNYLRPILGSELFDKLAEDYDDVSQDEDWYKVTTDKELVRLLRTCQKVAAYMMLANNSGLFSVSFNRGGGLNTMTADDYNTPDADKMKRFERDAWKKAHRNIDTLLLILENDARKDQSKYKELWKKSRYFFHQANLLFTTAQELNQYLDINESREKFISLIPDISYAQTVYIQPRIGEPLLRKLLEMKYGNDDSLKTELFQTFAEKVLSATALYVEQSQKDLRRDDSLNRADMQIALACRIVKENPQPFIDIIGRPNPELLKTVLHGIPIESLELPTETPATETPTNADTPKQEEAHRYNPRDPHNAVFALFGNGLRRY